MIDKGEDLSASMESTLTHILETKLNQLNTCLPGEVVAFYPHTQTADIQPTIQRLFDNEAFMPLPVCLNVPVIFPSGGKFFLTFPVEKGDECLLLFSQRCIDHWWLKGGLQNPGDFRKHHLSDAVAVVGLRSAPRSLPSVHSKACVVGTQSGDTYVEIGQEFIKLKSKHITIEGDARIMGDMVVNGINFNEHVHAGVQSGGSNTTAPINQPVS